MKESTPPSTVSDGLRSSLESAKRLVNDLAQRVADDRRSRHDADRILDERTRWLAQEPDQRDDQIELAEVLEFDLAHERYAVSTDLVREVCALDSITPLPGTPEFVLGLINVRGEILSLLDIRRLFGLPDGRTTGRHQVILLSGRNMSFGILADRIAGVRSLDARHIETVPTSASAAGSKFLVGVTNERIALINGERLLSDPAIIVDRSPTNARSGGRL
ncbi:MAG: chemotaxis protein CheW [Trueperaceae bacterium]